MRFGETMKEMCDSCPFGSSKKQRHMRKSLARGRFNEIAQSVWGGAYFPCHKTTEFDDDGEATVTENWKQCKGALEFVERASSGRREAQLRASRP